MTGQVSAADVPFTVLGGYLGAGKTTLLNRLLNDNQGLRIALLINDFGAINIDAELIERQTDQQINLTNGCVCCGLSDGFDEAISALLAGERPPEHIVVEASGVADVRSLAQYGRTPGLKLDATIVVADAQLVERQARDKYVANTVQRQLRAADLVVLNKADLVTAEKLAAVRAWLDQLTGKAPCLETSFCDMPRALLLGNVSAFEPKDSTRLAPAPSSAAAQGSHHHEVYTTWNYTSDVVLPPEEAQKLLHELPTDILRGKGFIATTNGLLEWHRVGRQERLTPVAKPSNNLTTSLVCIGVRQQFDAALLDEIANRHLSSAGRKMSEPAQQAKI